MAGAATRLSTDEARHRLALFGCEAGRYVPVGAIGIGHELHQAKSAPIEAHRGLIGERSQRRGGTRQHDPVCMLRQRSQERLIKVREQIIGAV